ncbi:proteasome regulatory subunit Rpn4 [Streptomyces murinus]
MVDGQGDEARLGDDATSHHGLGMPQLASRVVDRDADVLSAPLDQSHDLGRGVDAAHLRGQPRQDGARPLQKARQNGCVRRGQPQHPLGPEPFRGRPPPDRVGQRHHFARPHHDFDPEARRCHPRIAPDEQVRAQQPLDAHQLAADRRLRTPEDRRCPAETQRVGDRAENPQVSELEFHQHPSLIYEVCVGSTAAPGLRQLRCGCSELPAVGFHDVERAHRESRGRASCSAAAQSLKLFGIANAPVAAPYGIANGGGREEGRA